MQIDTAGDQNDPSAEQRLLNAGGADKANMDSSKSIEPAAAESNNINNLDIISTNLKDFGLSDPFIGFYDAFEGQATRLLKSITKDCGIPLKYEVSGVCNDQETQETRTVVLYINGR